MSRIITLKENDGAYTASFEYDFYLKECIKHECRGSWNPRNYTWSFDFKYLETLQKYVDENGFEIYFENDKKIRVQIIAIKKNNYTLQVKTRNLLLHAFKISYPAKTYSKLEIKELIQTLFEQHDDFIFNVFVKRIPLHLRFSSATYDVNDIFKYDELYDFQKKTIDFMAKRNFNGLISDEMGLGKTIQAIAVSQAAKSEKNIVICPLNVKSVWEQKIKEWNKSSIKIQSIKNKKTKIDNDAQWYILNYDVLVNLDKIFQLDDVTQAKIDKNIKKKFNNLDNISLKKKDWSKNAKYTVVQSGPIDLKQISFIKEFDVELYKELQAYYIDDLTNKLIQLNPVTLILDEAHNIKNPEAKKSIQVMKIAEACKNKILLTGTPFLNDESETEQLSRIILGKQYNQYAEIFKENRVKNILNLLMVRRKKEEVDIQLPEKTREWIDIPIKDSAKVKKVGFKYKNLSTFL